MLLRLHDTFIKTHDHDSLYSSNDVKRELVKCLHTVNCTKEENENSDDISENFLRII